MRVHVVEKASKLVFFPPSRSVRLYSLPLVDGDYAQIFGAEQRTIMLLRVILCCTI
ncbi:hypothetical protein [Rhizobium sp. BK251]|uniref:hypothetical protein n=1 Tax=Rhizobium sp. BK251 TaxID=2512125 RepID=UPI0010E647E6|nr:hypothetical protein [Rhizobium sp. BK251]TCL72850.1 hypothetical protein EV286_104277 [Rhizobium sp. BK251]